MSAAASKETPMNSINPIRSASASAGYTGIVAQLIERTEQQARLFDSGDMRRWHQMIEVSDDFTLMQPFGGPVTHGFDDSDAHLDRLSQLFRNGDARIDVEQVYATGEMVVLVFVEQQTGEVHGMPMQEWPLRVTQVYRRSGDTWQTVHRHADPLVHKLSVQHTADLAAGRIAAPPVG
jgi:ketosteroid isomerase-like protein